MASWSRNLTRASSRAMRRFAVCLSVPTAVLLIVASAVSCGRAAPDASASTDYRAGLPQLRPVIRSITFCLFWRRLTRFRRFPRRLGQRAPQALRAARTERNSRPLRRPSTSAKSKTPSGSLLAFPRTVRLTAARVAPREPQIKPPEVPSFRPRGAAPTACAPLTPHARLRQRPTLPHETTHKIRGFLPTNRVHKVQLRRQPFKLRRLVMNGQK